MRWRRSAHSCSFCRRASLRLPTVRPMRPYSRPSKAGGRTHIGDNSSSIGRNATSSSSELAKSQASGGRGQCAVLLLDSPHSGGAALGSERTAGMSNASSNASFVIPGTRPIPSVAVDGTAARFPVRRISALRRNYAAHAREMGRDPIASRRSSFSSHPTRSSTMASGCLTRRKPGTSTTRSSLSLRSALVARPFQSSAPSNMSTATLSAMI